MLRFSLYVLALLASLSFRPALASAHADNDLQAFQARIALMIEVRSRAYQFAEQNGILEGGTPKLTREQGNEMREIGAAYLQARKALLADTARAEPFFVTGSKLLLSARYRTGDKVRLSQKGAPAGDMSQRYLNPNDALGRRQLQEIQRGTAAALVLMDSYQIAVEPYAQNPSLRYLLSYDVSRRDSLRKVANNYNALSTRTQIAHATEFVDSYVAWQREQGAQLTPEEDYLYGLIQSTLWYAQARASGVRGIVDALSQVSANVGLSGQRIERSLSYGVSMGFGNMLGIVQTRRGKLTKLSIAEKTLLASELKPLDILLEKTPFRLTDKMIPGHYGHVAVWLGSEAELREIGVWDQIAPQHQKTIRNGGRIVEALRGGVTISTLEHFLNIDDLLVLRDYRKLDQAYRSKAVLTAVEQVGKEYDFNFDVLTHHRIVCSELAYVVFPDLSWPMAKTLGRYTISPDNVAQLAVGDDAVFEPAVIYHKGQRVDSAKRETLSQLIAVR